jgi:hypothetical protein
VKGDEVNAKRQGDSRDGRLRRHDSGCQCP